MGGFLRAKIGRLIKPREKSSKEPASKDVIKVGQDDVTQLEVLGSSEITLDTSGLNNAVPTSGPATSHVRQHEGTKQYAHSSESNTTQDFRSSVQRQSSQTQLSGKRTSQLVVPQAVLSDDKSQHSVVGGEEDVPYTVNIWNSAFSRAISNRTNPEDITALEAQTCMHDLFAQLSRADAEHKEQSYFRRGLDKLGSGMQGLTFVLDIASPVSNFEPAAASAFAITKSVTTKLGIALCGAEAALQENIQKLLYHIPIIDRCDELQAWEPDNLLQRILVQVYGDLLDFYFEASRILQSKHFAATLAKSGMQNRLKHIISSFTEHSTHLSTAIASESHAAIHRIVDEQINGLVRTSLEQRNTRAISSNHNRVRNRSDKACEWISLHSTWLEWLDLSSDVRFISLVGDMGNGKTWTTAYVVEVLRQRLNVTSFANAVIVSYYCMDDAESSEIRNIYRSLLRQLVTCMKRFKIQFFEWYKKMEAKMEVEPTESEHELGELLLKMFSSLRQPAFIIIDGLDECKFESRTSLLTLLGRASQMQSRLKVFVSHRPEDKIRQRLPPKSMTVQMQKSRLRDEYIARHIVDDSMGDLDSGLRRLIVDELSKKANGCAIWAIKRELEGMPSPERLAELYQRLFRKSTLDQVANERALVYILEFLTRSMRSITVGELACAVTLIASHGMKLPSLMAVEQLADPIRVCQLARPFISISDEIDSNDGIVTAVHQSLKEVVLKEPPITWTSKARFTPEALSKDEQAHFGSCLIAQCCISTLLLDDRIPEKRTSSAESSDTSSARGVVPLASSSTESSTPPPQRSYTGLSLEPWAQSPIVGTFFEGVDYINSGQVTIQASRYPFYGYSVVCWAAHFAHVQSCENSTLHALALDVYEKFRPADWTDILNIRSIPSDKCPSKPSALTMSCFHGHVHVAEHLHSSSTSGVGHLEIACAFYWAAAEGHIECVKFLSPYLGPDLRLCCVSGRSPLIAAAARGHTECVDFLLHLSLFGASDQDTDGRTALSHAAEGAHTSVVSSLLRFRKTEGSKGADVNISDKRGWSPLFWAAGPSSLETFKQLLRDQRTDPTLTDRKNRSALSWACEDGLAEIVKLLVQDQRVRLGGVDPSGKTPLIHAVRSRDYKTVKNLFRRLNSDHASPPDELDLELTTCDKEGRNAISWAASTARDLRVLKLLLEYSPNEAFVPDEAGWSPLAWTFDPPGYLDKASLLLAYSDGHIDDRDFGGNSVLSTAIGWGQFDIACIILEKSNIDVNSQNNSGKTALAEAASKGALEVVKALVETRDADASIADNKGILPVEYARDKGHTQISEYLESFTNAVAGASR